MSMQFIKAKKQLTGVSSLLKQGKLMAATTSLYEAVGFVLKTSLLKHEKQDFAQHIEQAAFQLANDKELKKIYPLMISYKEGGEKELLALLRDLLEVLQSNLNDQLKEKMIKIEEIKKKKLDQAQKMLEEQQYDEAKSAFDKLTSKFEDDVKLKVEVAQKLFDAGQYKEASEYIQKASHQDPASAHLFNKFAVELRKQGKFADAEQFYLDALKVSKQDEYLLFNLGRVYLDWKRWDMVEETASKALNLNKDFAEARKMLNFALKKQGK